MKQRTIETSLTFTYISHLKNKFMYILQANESKRKCERMLRTLEVFLQLSFNQEK